MDTKAIRALPKAQRDVLAAISMNRDEGHHPATLDALERKGFVTSHEVTLRGWPPVRIKRYDVPLSVHIAWCRYCSEEVKAGRLSEDE